MDEIEISGEAMTFADIYEEAMLDLEGNEQNKVPSPVSDHSLSFLPWYIVQQITKGNVEMVRQSIENESLNVNAVYISDLGRALTFCFGAKGHEDLFYLVSYGYILLIMWWAPIVLFTGIAELCSKTNVVPGPTLSPTVPAFSPTPVTIFPTYNIPTANPTMAPTFLVDDKFRGRVLTIIGSTLTGFGLIILWLAKGAIPYPPSWRLYQTKTALHIAAESSHLDIVTLLLQHPNCDVNATHLHVTWGDDWAIAFEWITALKLAFLQKNTDLIMMLIEAGAKNPHRFVKLSEFFSMDFSIKALRANNYFIWFHLLQMKEKQSFSVYSKVSYYVTKYPYLSDARDGQGRRAINVATSSNIRAINSVLLIHGRYRLCSSDPLHQSATCYVMEAFDEKCIGIDDKPLPTAHVALKFMFHKGQFLREWKSRADHNFEQEYVMNIICCYPEIGTEDSYPDIVDLGEEKINVKLMTKEMFEKLFLVVMPLAERNLYVSFKQDRFAGRDFETIKHLLRKLVASLMHIHGKGVLHSDLKPLNIMRKDGEWMLIDLDAASEIGKVAVGFKSSSAYIPPEAVYKIPPVYVSTDGTLAVVRSNETSETYGCAPLVASESFDVWSLGCILYQLVNNKVLPLWQADQDDNLSNDTNDQDNLFTLEEFSEEVKAKKLQLISDPLARNLVAQMLSKDPTKRPTLTRILAHTFLSGKSVIRLAGDQPEFDVFLSYRVASDKQHVQILYDLLTACGYTVWWDVKCLEKGKNWEEGFCEGLLNSRAFVCIISKDAINHPDKPWQNYGKLTKESKCDNVFLEHRLALELTQLGLLELIYPVFIGNPKTTGIAAEYEPWDWCNLPNAPDIQVQQVEEKLFHHMDAMALGMPLESSKSVKEVLSGITSNQGFFVEGERVAAFERAKNEIADMIEKSKKAT